jgi:hypothetical protein
MPAKLTVSEKLLPSVQRLTNAEQINVDVTADPDGAVKITPGAPGQQSASTELRAGGWISCSTAFETAGRLQVPPRDVGKLLNHLDIRIRACQLGCFE